MHPIVRLSPFVSLVGVAACAMGNPQVPQTTLAPSAASIATSAPEGVTAAQPNPVGRTAHVPEATFRMGSDVGEPDERPAHMVRVAAFDLDVTEVTVEQYSACVRAGACRKAPTVITFPGVTFSDQQLYDGECNGDRADRPDHPENCVDWSMADAYCHWAGKRLPTEEEWEYAACGGSCDEALTERGGAGAVLGAERWPFTTRVASHWPGKFGLYDMAGNVWEWTASQYCPYDRPGCGDARRVIRGGSWSMVDFLFVRLTDRSPADPTTRNTNLGFRCAR
ncbi:MAG TPA: SUMF1/EgtB/PvdO family nonheme iron enzyme [Polyangiaceae bacterium]|nr:SUMF1/EgtB/PvdO family nonheme iron enzyme [Polyangiaceae bacterium]